MRRIEYNSSRIFCTIFRRKLSQNYKKHEQFEYKSKVYFVCESISVFYSFIIQTDALLKKSILVEVDDDESSEENKRREEEAMHKMSNVLINKYEKLNNKKGVREIEWEKMEHDDRNRIQSKNVIGMDGWIKMLKIK